MLFAIPIIAVCTIASAGTPKLLVEQPTYDAGARYRTGENIEHAFIIKNAGTAELKILSAQPG
ncbi:MAG TPA: hypothetical protein VI958_10100 [Acidobacteriota bacterium]